MSVSLQNSLSKLKVGTIKTKREIPEVGQFTDHFWRGVWDADGGICKRKRGGWTVYISGTEKYVAGFNQWVKDKTGIDKGVEQGKGCKMINWHRKEEIKKILEALYTDATVYLDRKKKKFDQFVSEYDNPVFKTRDGKTFKKTVIYRGFDEKLRLPDEISAKMREKSPLEYISEGETIHFWSFPQENMNITANLAQKTVFVTTKSEKILYRNT